MTEEPWANLQCNVDSDLFGLVRRDCWARLGSLDDDVLAARVWLLYDKTGGEIKAALEQHKKRVSIDSSKIPDNTKPLLVGARLDETIGGRVLRGKRSIGNVIYAVTSRAQAMLTMSIHLDEPIYYSYEETDYLLPEMLAGPWKGGQIHREANRWGISGTWTFLVASDLTHAWPDMEAGEGS